MTEAKITRITQIEDPKLRAFADQVANGLMAAGWKAAAHLANPKQVALPAGDTLESRFLTYLRGRPAAVQKKLSAQALTLVQTKKVPGLEGLDLLPARPTLDIARGTFKLERPTLTKVDLLKRAGPVLEGGVPGFRKQSGPTELLFGLTSVKCVDETNGFAGSELGSDEMALGGLMVDAAGNTVKIPQIKLGDFNSDGHTKNYDPPKPVGKLNFLAGSGWPKSFSLVLVLVEKDNGNFPEFLTKLFDEGRAAVLEAIDKVGRQYFGDAIADAVASALTWVFDKVFNWLKSAWEDDLFEPVTFNFEFPTADARFAGGGDEMGLWVDWRGHGGHYKTWLVAQLGPLATAGHGELYESLGNGDIRHLRQHTRWRRTWSRIVSGDFGLLFYDAQAGVGEFWRPNAQGGVTLVRQHSGWRKTWRQIVPGNFSNKGGTDLLLYDAAGVGEFYAVDSQGALQLVRQHSGWRKTWTHIVPGNFGGDGFTDLLFYDSSKGEAEFHRTDGTGQIHRMAAHSGWRRSWTHIVPGNFGGTGFTDILLYDAATGEAEFYQVNQGQMTLLRKHTGWRKTWTHIVPGDFGGDGFTDLLLYDKSKGEAEIFCTDGKGDMKLLRKHTGWRKTWAQLVPASFAGKSWTDLVFYDPTA